MAAEHPKVYERIRVVALPYIRHVCDVHPYPACVIWLMQLFGGSVLLAVAVNDVGV